MGKQYRVYLAGESVFVCRQCGNHLAVGESVISKVSLGRLHTSERKGQGDQTDAGSWNHQSRGDILAGEEGMFL